MGSTNDWYNVQMRVDKLSFIYKENNIYIYHEGKEIDVIRTRNESIVGIKYRIAEYALKFYGKELINETTFLGEKQTDIERKALEAVGIIVK